MADWVKVLPGEDPGQTARDLLSLATSAHDVRTSSDDGLAFVVPAWLAEQYDTAIGEIATVEEQDEPVAPKRRGRARKEL